MRRWNSSGAWEAEGDSVANLSRMRRYTQLLGENRSFRNLWIGQSINFLGDSFYDIALIWYVYTVTHSAVQSGLVLVFTFLPSVIVGIWFGALVDKTDRKLWLVMTSVVQACAAAAFALIILTGRFRIWEVYVITFCLATGEVAFGPAWNSSMPDVVPADQLVSANAMMAFSRRLFQMLGSALGGAVIAVIGTSAAVCVDAASFLTAAWFFGRTAIPVHARPTVAELERNEDQSVATPSLRADIVGGARWLLSQSNLVVILIVSTFSNMSLGPTNVLPAMYLQTTLHAGAEAFGLFDAAIGLGMMVSVVWIGSRDVRRAGLWLAYGLSAEALAMAIVAAAPNIWVADIGNFVLGVAVMTAGIPLTTMFQALVPQHMRGRVGGITNAVTNVSIPLTYALVGVLGDSIGARWTYGIGACCLVLCGIVAFAAPAVRNTGLPGLASASQVSKEY